MKTEPVPLSCHLSPATPTNVSESKVLHQRKFVELPQDSKTFKNHGPKKRVPFVLNLYS